MEITEKERAMLEKERDEIKRLTSDIIALEKDPMNTTKIKQDILAIQSSLSRLASYSNTNCPLYALTKSSIGLLSMLNDKLTDKQQKMLEQVWFDPSKEVPQISKADREKFHETAPPPNEMYPYYWVLIVDKLDKYCCYVNSIKFGFKGKSMSVTLPKITLPKNFSIFSLKNG